MTTLDLVRMVAVGQITHDVLGTASVYVEVMEGVNDYHFVECTDDAADSKKLENRLVFPPKIAMHKPLRGLFTTRPTSKPILPRSRGVS